MSIRLGKINAHTLTIVALACLLATAARSAPQSQGSKESQPAPTTTTITNAASVAIPTAVGQPFTVQWSVTVDPPGSGTPTGVVQVKLDDNVACSAVVGNGQCTVQPFTTGTFMVTAEYLGDPNFEASTSPPVEHRVGGVSDVPPATVAAFALLPPRPTPSHGVTFVGIELPVASRASLIVFDASGRQVGEVLRDELLPAGRVIRRWDPSGLPAGVYILRARVGGHVLQRRMVWLGK